jgi:hypothetical protein
MAHSRRAASPHILLFSTGCQMMRSLFSLVCAFFIVSLIGCGPPPNPVKETPEELYAMQIKRRIRDAEAALKTRNPKMAAQTAMQRLNEMTEDLDMYEKRSGPDDKATYAEIQKIQRELIKQSASGGLAEKVKQMKTLADKLPGKLE